MAGKPVKMGAVLIAALVPFYDPHFCWLTDDGDAGGEAAVCQNLPQMLRPETADFLIIGEGEMHRPVGHLPGKQRRHGQGGGDETLHIAGAAPVKPAVPFDHFERIGLPLLIADRHNVRMA